MGSVKWTDKIKECPEYRPTVDEFEDPLLYLQKIAPEASKYGICKIKSPLKAHVSAVDVLTKEEGLLHFRTVFQPLQLAPKEVSHSVGKTLYTTDTFEKKAEEIFQQIFPHSDSLSTSAIEENFWREMTLDKTVVEYSVDLPVSAFSANPQDQLGQSNWNLKKLPKQPQCVLRTLSSPPKLKIGMIYSIFPWNVTDQYLYSIDYHHSGAPRTWYGVPGHEALKFERVVRDHVYAEEDLPITGEDQVFLKIEKASTMFSPDILLQNDISVYKAVQMPGHFVVTFPKAYHGGFCNGFNCSEAVKFATGDWFPFGKEAADRYARLCQKTTVPFEALLIREATSLHESIEGSELSDTEIASQSSIITSFTQHMNSLNSSLLWLNNKKVGFEIRTDNGAVNCHICKRECYLAFIQCGERKICLFHGFKSLRDSRVLLRRITMDAEKVVRDLEYQYIMSCIKNALFRPPKIKIKLRKGSSSQSSKQV